MQAAQKELAHLVGSEGEAHALLGKPGGKCDLNHSLSKTAMTHR
jgi:hypothetical protein